MEKCPECNKPLTLLRKIDIVNNEEDRKHLMDIKRLWEKDTTAIVSNLVGKIYQCLKCKLTILADYGVELKSKEGTAFLSEEEYEKLVAESCPVCHEIKKPCSCKVKKDVRKKTK